MGCCGRHGENTPVIEASSSADCAGNNPCCDAAGLQNAPQNSMHRECCGGHEHHGAAPYYQTVSMCPEESKVCVRVEKLVGAFKNVSAFAVPACGASVRVAFSHVGDVPIGAWLWCYGIGYLTIVGFNPNTGEIELKNECPTVTCANQTQAAPGTPIPACSVFVLMPPACNSQSGGGTVVTFPYLDSGFVAPASGACIDIAVTNTNGLSVNAEVMLNTGTYRVSAVKSATLITICNDGSGLTPGTVVEYKDSAGNLIVPITLIQSNPCLNSASLSGKLIVCKNNTITPLTGLADNQVPVFNTSTGEVNFRTLAIPTLDCTELTVCLTLDPALPAGTPYLTTVLNTAAYAAGQTVVIGATVFTVSSIISPTQLYLIPQSTPSAIQTYPVGATMCSADCCTILSEKINDQRQLRGEGGSDINSTGITLGKSVSSPVATVTVTNTSTTKTMIATFAMDVFFKYSIIGADGTVALVSDTTSFIASTNPAGVPTPLFVDENAYQVLSGITNWHSRHAGRVGSLAVPPGTSITVNMQGTVAFEAGNADHLSVHTISPHVTVLGVAIQ